nr:MAG TPA: hypothetical protein [Caudoviricetes sp.]
MIPLSVGTGCLFCSLTSLSRWTSFSGRFIHRITSTRT